MRRPLPLIILAVLIFAGLSGISAMRWLMEPSLLRVAVGPATSEDHRLLTSLAQMLRREKAEVQLRIITTNGSRASAQLLENRTADLALVRSDVAIPANGMQIAILHNDIAALIAPPSIGVTQVGDLRGKTIGVVKGGPANIQLLERLLAYYDLPRAEWSVKGINPHEINDALATSQIQAVFAVGLAGSAELQDIVSKVMLGLDAPPVFIPLNETQAIAQTGAMLQSAEITKGAFGGSPPRPASDVSTIAVAYRLLAHRYTSEKTVTALTQQIFALRTALAADTPLANRIEAPSTEPGTPIPVHPGAAAYLDGDVKTFMERYGDWFYIIVMLGGILGSAVAGIAGFISNKSGSNQRSGDINELARLFPIIRKTQTMLELDAIEDDLEDIFAATIDRAVTKKIDDTALTTFTLVCDQARARILERRRILAARTPQEPSSQKPPVQEPPLH